MKKMMTMAAIALMAIGCKPAQAQQSTDEQKVQATGTDYEQQLSELDKEAASLAKEYQQLAEKETAKETEEGQARLKTIMEGFEELQGKYVGIIIQMAKANHGNTKPVKYIKEIGYALNYHQLKELLDPTAAYYDDPALAEVKQRFQLLQKRAPGTAFRELVMKDPEGNTRKLSEWCGKGNYVLVDFWASWCGPCRMEMPNVVEAYQKYHGKGFDVVGVSLDNKANAWKEAIKSLQMPWHHISDLKAWKSGAMELYGLTSIPANVLLDGEGNIVDLDLRGAALQKKLEEIYSTPQSK